MRSSWCSFSLARSATSLYSLDRTFLDDWQDASRPAYLQQNGIAEQEHIEPEIVRPEPEN